MADMRPLPVVIGPTEHALQALLMKTLSSTRITSHAAWVVLNAAASASSATPPDGWRGAVADALKVEPKAIDDELAQLMADGLVAADATPTARGAAELASARDAFAHMTTHLTEGIDEDEQAVVRQVLERVRHRAEHLLAR